MEYIEWLKEQIDSLNDTQDDFRYGMLKAFELCLEKYEESDDKEWMYTMEESEVKEAIEMSKVDAFDKMRAEIVDCLKALDNIEKSGFNIYLPNEISGRRLTYHQCLEIIDKYRTESEDEA